jgi:hypothetical protein
MSIDPRHQTQLSLNIICYCSVSVASINDFGTPQKYMFLRTFLEIGKARRALKKKNCVSPCTAVQFTAATCRQATKLLYPRKLTMGYNISPNPDS